MRKAKSALHIALYMSIFPILMASFALQAAEKPFVPDFWASQERLVKPVSLQIPRLLFLTTTDFPPFSFIDQEKRLKGFHVDLARALCDELALKAQCQIQALPFDEIEKALNAGKGEAALAGIAITGKTREKLNFSRPYFHLPARFIAKRESAFAEPLIDQLGGKTVGVIAGSAHAAYAHQYFDTMHVRLFADQEQALAALQGDQIDAVFADGLALAFWMQRVEDLEKICCHFIGKAYLSQHYFGNGLAVSVAKGNVRLEKALNYALRSINDKGTFAELYLRYFPISLY